MGRKSTLKKARRYQPQEPNINDEDINLLNDEQRQAFIWNTQKFIDWIRPMWAKGGKRPAVVSEIVEFVYKRLDKIIKGFSKMSNWESPACQQGCNYCCYLEVHAEPAEIFYLTNKLRKTLSLEKRQQLQSKLEETAKVIQGTDKISRFAAKIPCALLAEDGTCSVYKYRPISCRSYFSTDVSVCQQDGSYKIHPSYISVGRAVYYGLAAANYYEGLEPYPVELNAGLAQALKTPDLERR